MKSSVQVKRFALERSMESSSLLESRKQNIQSQMLAGGEMWSKREEGHVPGVIWGEGVRGVKREGMV